MTLRAFEFVGAGVLEIRHHVIDRRFDGIRGRLMELHAVAGIGHFGTRNDETAAIIEYVHVQVSPLSNLLVRAKFAPRRLSICALGPTLALGFDWHCNCCSTCRGAGAIRFTTAKAG